jgi:ABC-type transport system involved in multi-copper enzyme maturation permease subunit
MIFGPVFFAELLRSARRMRYYVLRMAYGAVLWLLIWSAYSATFHGSSVGGIGEVSRFAEETFLIFALVQFVVVLMLVPALFAGVIADEKQCKTLHYLMASRISSGEIVADKVLGRAAHLAIFLLIGIPVVACLALSGGIPPEYVAAAYVCTFSTAAFTIALAVLVSTLARQVKQAVLIAYLLMFLWLFVPPVLDMLWAAWYPASHQWVGPVLSVFRESSPVDLAFGSLFRARGGVGRGFAAMLLSVEHMLALQLGGAVMMLALAIWRLRPTFRQQEVKTAPRPWFRKRQSERPRRRSWLARPACGDDAVLWKERWFAPSDRFTRLVLLPSIVAITLVLVFFTEMYGGVTDVVRELIRLRRFSDWRLDRTDFVTSLRVDLAWYTAFWILAVAGAAAACVSMEREQDTWTSLISAPLSGWQIMRGKLLGAIWNQRGFGAVLVGIWILMAITGAATLFTLVASIVITGVLTWFAASLGAYASLRASNTSRALAVTILALAVVNGYPVSIMKLFLGTLRWDSSFAILGFMPKLATGLFEKDPFVFDPNVPQFVRYWQLSDQRAFVWTCFWGMLLLVLGLALLLTWAVVVRFDRWLDRPTMSLVERPDHLPAKKLGVIVVAALEA